MELLVLFGVVSIDPLSVIVPTSTIAGQLSLIVVEFKYRSGIAVGSVTASTAVS